MAIAKHCNLRPPDAVLVLNDVIERLVLARLRPHLLASRLQSACRRGHSTETALLHVMNSVYAAADEKKVTVLVGLDLSAAFDTITMTSSSAVSKASSALTAVLPAGCTRTSQTGSSS